jgi:class 3 adenylate cyclase
VCGDGDVFGATVNLAARLADKARSSEILTHSRVVNGASSRKVNWKSIGRTVLKGLAPMEVYSSMPAGE